VFLADLETRYKALENVPGDSVRAYRDYLWFDRKASPGPVLT
jgi:hypothetical protein